MPRAAPAVAMPEDDTAEATLELTIVLSGNGGLRRGSSSVLFLPSKPKPFAIVWIDPAAKRSIKALFPGDRDSKTHLPLSSRILGDPGASVTIQILHPRFPFYRGGGGSGGGARVEGAAAVPLSSLSAAAGRTLTLPLYGSSGRARGFVCISARVFWCLGPSSPPPPPPPETVPSVEYTEWTSEAATAPLMESEQMESLMIEPTAPPMPEEDAEKQPFRLVPNAPWIPDEVPEKTLPEAASAVECYDRVSVVATGVPADTRQIEFSMIEPKAPKTQGENGRITGAWRSFLVGLASGTLALVLFGAAGFSGG